VTSSIKPEVHNISQRRQTRNEPRSKGICTNFVKIGRAVPEICSRTDTQTDRQTDSNTSLPYRGGVMMMMMMMMIIIIIIIMNYVVRELHNFVCSR